MKKITSIVRNLDQLETYITDTSALSSNIFNLTFLPNEFTLGKNLIKFKGVPNVFQPGTDLLIEILDSNRNPIYHEVINVIESDQSRIIAVYIYDTTVSGDCTITFAGTLQSNNNVTIPSTWANIINAKWSVQLPVNTKSVNTSEIIFDSLNLPEVTIEEQIGVRLDRSYESNQQFPTFTTGLIEFETTNDVSVAKIIGGEFRPEMVGGTLTVTSPVNPTPISTVPTSSAKSYSSKIQKVLSKDFIQLENKFLFTLSQSLSQHQYTKFDASSYSISYEASPNYIATQHSESFALTQIKNLDPATGDISRIKLYINSSGTIGTYEQINDILLEPTEIFVDATGSILPDVGVGFFTSQSIINEYWEAHTYIGKTEATAPTLTFSTSSLSNAVIVTPSVDYRDNNEVLVFQTKPSLPGTFIKDSDYKIIFDAIGSKNSLSNFNNPKISIFLSGSAFNNNVTTTLNSFFPVSLGKKIGELELQTTEQRLDDQQFIFNADQTGNGSLLFVIESGQWQFSDVRTLTSAESGYTENYTRFRTDIPVKHKSNNEIKFKIEYYNIDGVKSTHETIVENKIFEGGNRYIDGGFSMLTGSLTVADTLNSGVEIVGLQNTGYIRSLGYQGFNQATGSSPGGFLLFSGSALPTQTATSYEGVGLELVSDANNFFRYRTNPSRLDVHTETFFLGNPSTQFISGSNGQLEISSSGYHIQPTGDITASRFLMQGGTITNDVTILGSVSANSILTPATINGSPANENNASASISDQGLAIFRSASIAGFTINTEEIKSADEALRLKSGGQITASRVLLSGGTITDGVTILGSVTANAIQTPATIGGSPSTPANASSSISSEGLAIFRSASIAGFEINTEEIKSPGNTLRLKSAGQITASDGFLFGNKASSNFVQFANNTLTVRGDLSVDQIFTPATIGGSPSDITNASSSITSTGFAKFTSASIGGWDITTGSIEAGNLIMKPEGILQTKDFASGFKGWKISSQGNGTAEFENVRIRGTLRTTTFEKESVNAIGGQVWVANATTITGSGVAITDTTMSVKNASGFSVNEILLAKKVDSTGFQTEYLLVESASLDGNNSNEDEVFGRIYVQRAYGSGSGGSFVGDLASNSQSYDEGQVIVSTGKIGTGYIKINANPNDADTPFIDIVERTGSGLYDVKLKARLGDLGGLANSDSVFGNSNPGFGLQTDNVFLQGGIRANTGSIGGIDLEDNKLYIGVGNHANSNTGFYVDSSSKFSLGDKLTWDGSALTVQGQLRLNSGQTVDNAINEATASNTAKTLVLTADSQVFAFPSASSTSATPTSIIFSIAQQNLTASISASDITITTAGGSSVTGFDFDTGSVTANSSTPPLYSGVVSGSLTFAGALSAGGLNSDKTNLPVTIVASRDGLSDTTKIFKVEGGSSGSDGADGAAGADGAPAVTAFLTNEAHTFPADVNGTISSFTEGSSSMVVFVGLENSTSSFSYSKTDSTGVTSTLSGTHGNVIAISAMAHDSGSVDITATSASVSVTKTMTLAKSKQGAQGTTGATGATGPNFDFLTGSISQIDTTGGLSAGLIMTSDVLGFHGNISAGDGTNATINDFVSFLDSSGNFFIGSASAGHFAYSQTTGKLLISGSEVDIRTPKFFLGSKANQFVSGSNGLLEISSSNFHLTTEGNVTMSGTITSNAGNIGGFEIDDISISSTNDNLILSSSGQVTASSLLLTGGSVGGLPVSNDEISVGSVLKLKNSGQITGSNVLFSGGEIGGFNLTSTEISSSGLLLKSSGQITGSKVLLEGGRITSGVTIEGSVTANAIRTPATIGGSPSTTSNASSSIDSNGFAIFKSASIAGFEVTTDEISGGFIPASSSVTNTTVSASLQLDGTLETSTVSVDSFTTNAGGAAFWEDLRQSGTNIFIKSNDGVSYYNVAESSTNNFKANSSVAGATISILNGFVETGFSDKLHTLVDSGGSTLTAVSSSTTIFPETPAPLQLKSNGQITASAGLIAGTEISSTKLSSTTNLGSPDSSPAFELTSAGVISGSEAYIRRVTNLGSGNQVFPLLDSRIGLVDGRNLGRQLAESYTEHARSNVDDGTTYNTVATHVAQLLPYENTLVASFQMVVRSLGASTNGQVRFLVETTANSGSYTGTSIPSQYDSFGTSVGTMSKSITRGSSGFNSFLAFGDESVSLSIAESNQARFIRISVQLLVNPFNTQSANSFNSVTLKGYSIIATRQLGGASIGNATGEFPGVIS